MRQSALTYHVIHRALLILSPLLFALGAEAQIQVGLKLPRLQYIVYEPVVTALGITNLAGRDIDLQDSNGESWRGVEVTGSDWQTVDPISVERAEATVK